MTSFVKNAQAAFADGDFALAISLYEQAIFEQPELAGIYRFNLERARAKLGEGASPSSSVGSAEGVYLRDLYNWTVPTSLSKLTLQHPVEGVAG